VKILIADDDRTTRLILRMLLNENYFDVVGEAADGAKAVELWEKLRPDIVFMDIDMPKLNGHEATMRIRQQSATTGIVIISALASAKNVKQAIDSGANGFVVKPFNTTRVVEAIENCKKLVC
jgi:two-component system, chemotaxis family, chemotaxis protein CheY